MTVLQVFDTNVWNAFPDHATWGEVHTFTALAGGKNTTFTAVIAPLICPTVASLWNANIAEDYDLNTIRDLASQIGMTLEN